MVNTIAPFTADELAGRAEATFPVAVSSVMMLSVAELASVFVGAQIMFMLPDEMVTSTDISLGLEVIPSTVREEALIPLPVAGFTLPEWFSVQGRPRQVTDMVVSADVTIGVGAPYELQTYPDPRDVAIGASSRWLPLNWTMSEARDQWWPYTISGIASQASMVSQLPTQFGTVFDLAPSSVDVLSGRRWITLAPDTTQLMETTPGATPTLLRDYSYWRSGGQVRYPAMSFSSGDYMWHDNVNWNTEEVTAIAVVVLRQPQSSWYSVLETSAPGEDALEPFFGIRYDASGSLVLWGDSELVRLNVASGQNRPLQPVIVGMNIDMVANTCSLLTVDRQIQIQTTALPHRYDNRSRLYLGRSPHGQRATANMEVLEFSLFEQRMSHSDLMRALAQYDRIYGVSAS